jgi:hypothetical protein
MFAQLFIIRHMPDLADKKLKEIWNDVKDPVIGYKVLTLIQSLGAVFRERFLER